MNHSSKLIAILPEQSALAAIPLELGTPQQLISILPRVKRAGIGPGSLEAEETAGLDYHVLNRSLVESMLPQLIPAYHALAPVVSEALGFEVVPTQDEGSVNVNLLSGVGGRYELHLDSQPYTVLVFATTQGIHHGDGELNLDNSLIVQPKFGLAVLINGAVIPHGVKPLSACHGHVPVRISIPMVFKPKDAPDVRPNQTDAYLYGR